MPELPEAENIGRALKTNLVNQEIAKVEVFSPKMRTSLLPLLDAKLEGLTIVDVRRRARYLVVDLSDKRALLMHFGMSGVVRIEDESVPKRKHEHVFIHLKNGKIFRFECTRRFSLLECVTLGEDNWPLALANLGVEPLEENFTSQYLFEKSRKVKGAVKNFIMDNNVVTGIGNIYATEVLFACKIHPQRPASSLSKTECDNIVKYAKKILTRAIELGGTTISDFQNVDGSEGKFVQELNIYGKKGQKCVVCNSIVETVTVGGRTSAFCPNCQKL
jgi:formamidopyrimidine-DNA glycosylase